MMPWGSHSRSLSERPFAVICNHSQSLAIICSHLQSCAVIGSPWRSLSESGSHSRSLGSDSAVIRGRSQTNETCHTHEESMWHRRMSHVINMHESWHWLSESWHSSDGSHVTQQQRPRAYSMMEWYRWMSHVINMHQSWHCFDWVMALFWWESCNATATTKGILDDAVVQSFEDAGFSEDHRLSNLKLFLGALACAFALLAQVPLPPPFAPRHTCTELLSLSLSLALSLSVFVCLSLSLSLSLSLAWSFSLAWSLSLARV